MALCLGEGLMVMMLRISHFRCLVLECLLIEAGGLNLGQVLVLLVLVQQEVHSVVPEQQDVGT